MGNEERGISEEMRGLADQRVYLPAEHVVAVMDSALAYADTGVDPSDGLVCEQFRDDVAFIFNFCDFGRSDTQSGMRERDVAIDVTGRLFFVLHCGERIRLCGR